MEATATVECPLNQHKPPIAVLGPDCISLSVNNEFSVRLYSLCMLSVNSEVEKKTFSTKFL